VRREWIRRADTLGQRVSIDGATGIAVDLDPDGGLVLQEGGRRFTVAAGEIDAARR
jgi:biotin-(acetyl-CoA carboxylase) ligase